MNQDIHQVPPIGWVAIAIILFTQGSWLFMDASKRNAYPWFWGIWGMMTFPMPTILYLIFVRKILKRKKK